MKRLLSILSILSIACTAAIRAQEPPPSVNWSTSSWEAPSQVLPNTEWYDYGWDSTSNGPIPAELAQRRTALRLAGRLPAPPPPPAPEVGRAAPRAPQPEALRLAQYDGSRGATRPTSATQPATPNPEPETPSKKAGLAYNEPKPGRLYLDSFLSLRTPNFVDANYGYGIGIGYQVNRYWSGEVRAIHHGLDYDGSAIQDIGGRLVARMPFEFLAPYTFLGASFDLESDAWHLQPGAGIELGVHQSLKGLSIFAEGGLDADLKGRSGYLFSSGVRIRF